MLLIVFTICSTLGLEYLLPRVEMLIAVGRTVDDHLIHILVHGHRNALHMGKSYVSNCCAVS